MMVRRRRMRRRNTMVTIIPLWLLSTHRNSTTTIHDPKLEIMIVPPKILSSLWQVTITSFFSQGMLSPIPPLKYGLSVEPGSLQMMTQVWNT